MKYIQIHYHALLREKRGCSSEKVETSAKTPAALYEELDQKYRLDIPREKLKVAMNYEMCSWDEPLSPHDIISFIPPVAGG